MSRPPARSAIYQRLWRGLLLVLLLAGVVRLAWDLVAHWDQLLAGDALRYWLLLTLRGAALPAGLWALWLLARTAEPPPRPQLRWLLPAAAGILLTAVATASLVEAVAELGDDRFAVRSAFRSALLIATSVWVFLQLRSAAGRRRGRLLGLVAVNVLVSLAVTEGAARLLARAYPTRLLWDERSARATIEANRLPPGVKYLGFAANSGGYYDREFVEGGPDDLVVALVADSFGLGIVPFKHSFAQAIERRLARDAKVAGQVAVNNYGVAGIGLPEYVWLVKNEVPATSPTRVVVGLFVGNDISGLESRRRNGHYSLQQLQLFELGRRLTFLARARPRAPGGGLPTVRRGPPSDIEGGTFAEATFIEIELAALELCNRRSRHMAGLYRSAFDWLGRLHDAAGDSLLLVLIPDEYQVNDELYAALLRLVSDPAAYDRLLPQRRIQAFSRRRGIEVLDLLEPLRRAQRSRPVYRLRDTHWNARGNRIAGEEVARRLLATPTAEPGLATEHASAGRSAQRNGERQPELLTSR